MQEVHRAVVEQVRSTATAVAEVAAWGGRVARSGTQTPKQAMEAQADLAAAGVGVLAQILWGATADTVVAVVAQAQSKAGKRPAEVTEVSEGAVAAPEQ